MPRQSVSEPTEGEKQRAHLSYQLKLKGVLASDIAELLGVSHTLVSRVLAGERVIGEEAKRVRAEVARVLGKEEGDVFLVAKTTASEAMAPSEAVERPDQDVRGELPAP